MRDTHYFLICLAAGTGAGFLRIALIFFPGFNLMEVVVFGVLAAVFTPYHRTPRT